MESKTDILFQIRKNKEKHEAVKAEMLKILDEIDELGNSYNEKKEILSSIEDEYVELWGKYSEAK